MHAPRKQLRKNGVKRGDAGALIFDSTRGRFESSFITS
jgi:hypothetical protein